MNLSRFSAQKLSVFKDRLRASGNCYYTSSSELYFKTGFVSSSNVHGSFSNLSTLTGIPFCVKLRPWNKKSRKWNDQRSRKLQIFAILVERFTLRSADLGLEMSLKQQSESLAAKPSEIFSSWIRTFDFVILILCYFYLKNFIIINLTKDLK